MRNLLVAQYRLSAHGSVGSLRGAKRRHQRVGLDFARIGDPVAQLLGAVAGGDSVQCWAEGAHQAGLAWQGVAGNAVARVACVHDAKTLLRHRLRGCWAERHQRSHCCSQDIAGLAGLISHCERHRLNWKSVIPLWHRVHSRVKNQFCAHMTRFKDPF